MGRVLVLGVLLCWSAGAADWRSGVSATVRDLDNPYEKDGRGVEGRQLFRDYCSDCHGEKGGGTRRAPSLRSRRVAEARPGEVLWLLRNGVRASGMPSFSALTDRELWKLVTFVRGLHGASSRQTAARR